MNYLLDSNASIALINGKPPSACANFQKATDAGAQVFVSSVILFELWYGVEKSSRREFNKERLEHSLQAPSIRSLSRMGTPKSLAQFELTLRLWENQ